MPNALILYGGWLGHQPERFVALAKDRLLNGCDVETTSDLTVLESCDLNHRELILPIWTQGELTCEQEGGLLRAIEDGTGLVASTVQQTHSAAILPFISCLVDRSQHIPAT